METSQTSMHKTNIGIFKIAQTRVNWPSVVEWLEFLGIKNVDAILQQLAAPSIAGSLPGKDLNHWTLQKLDECPATDASALISLCGKRCYASFDTESKLNPNVTKIRTDHKEYVVNVLKSGHGSILEHATWSFSIENVSRVFTGEMNRHRAGVAISEASMRYIRFDDIGFTVPASLELTDNEIHHLEKANKLTSNDAGRRDRMMAHFLLDQRPSEFMKYTTTEEQDIVFTACRKLISLDAFEKSFEGMQKLNLDLCNIWKIEEMTDFTKKKQLTSMFRRIIGMGVSTGGVWTINARALRHILALRGSVHAEEEIFHVFSRIADIMIADEPLLFGDFVRNEEGWVAKYPKV